MRKVTVDDVKEWVRLYEEGYSFVEIGEKYGRSSKTVSRHVKEYLQKRPAAEEGKGLRKEGKIDKEFMVFKMQKRLIRAGNELLKIIETIDLEYDLMSEMDFIREKLDFLIGKAENATDLETLSRIEELLYSELKEILALTERDSKLRRWKKEQEREAKRRWIIQRLKEEGWTEEEIEKHIEEQGLEHVYNMEKEAERDEKTMNECLKYMSPEDYIRLRMLFAQSLDPPSARYLINFWKQEKDIIAEYGARELKIFYETHRDLIAEKPNLKTEFERYIKGKYPYNNRSTTA